MSKLFFGGVKIPEWWIDIAALAGKESNSTGVVHIGLMIWQQSNMRRQLDGLRLPVSLLSKKGFGRYYVRTALEVLESEGLIHVKRFPHRSPEITLVTSRAEARMPKPTPEVTRVIRVATAVQDRDRLGRFVGEDHG